MSPRREIEKQRSGCWPDSLLPILKREVGQGRTETVTDRGGGEGRTETVTDRGGGEGKAGGRKERKR